MGKRRAVVIERRLGREKAFGQAYMGLDIIEVDPRQDERERLDTIIHELLHLLLPGWSEREVIRGARWISQNLWREKYRRVR